MRWGLTPLQRCSRCILHFLPTEQFLSPVSSPFHIFFSFSFLSFLFLSFPSIPSLLFLFLCFFPRICFFLIYIYIYISPQSIVIYIYIYTYIVIHRQSIFLYHNASVWLDTQAGIETQLILRQSNISPQSIVILSVSEGIFYVYFFFTYTLWSNRFLSL